jgi:hypothetical protein
MEARRDHLVREATRQNASSRLQSLVFAGRVKRLAVVGAAAVVASVVAYSSVMLTTGGTELASAAVKISLPPSPINSSGSAAPRQTVVNVVQALKAREDLPAAAVTGGSPVQQQIVRGILSRMPNNSLTKVAIVPRTYMGTDGVALEFESQAGDLTRSQWEEALVAGAFRSRSEAAGLTPVVGYPTESPSSSPPGDTAPEIEARVRAAASSAKADIIDVQVDEPNGFAPAVILQVDDPARFLAERLMPFLNKIGWRDYEGSYVDVIDSN